MDTGTNTEEAKERRKNLNNEETAPENFTEANKGNALGKIAGFIGISRPTLQKVERIVEAVEQNPQNQPIFS